MNKFRLELTDEQLVVMSAITTAIIIGKYDKLSDLKEVAKSIGQSLLLAEHIDEEKDIETETQESNFETVPCEQNTLSDNDSVSNEVCVSEYATSNDDVSEDTDFLPDQFYSTYNSFVEQVNNGKLINYDKECLRYGFGKKGQLGIQYWDAYEGEPTNPTKGFYMNSKDAVKMSDLLNAVVSALYSEDSMSIDKKKKILDLELKSYCDDIQWKDGDAILFVKSSKQNCFSKDRGYELEITNGAFYVDESISPVMFITKKDVVDVRIPFHTKQQVILLDEFLNYHLGK